MRRALAILLLLAGTAEAAPGVDWATGRVVAAGVGLADRQAPNPAVARGTSRRKAEDAARLALRTTLGSLPIAGGGTLADKLADKAVAARLDRAIAAALPVSAEPETDGGWTVELAVPTEAVRQAIAGTRALADAGDAGPAAIVVEGVTAAPAVGYTVGGIAGATIFVTAVPAWAKSAPRVKARGTTGAAIDADVAKATPSTLFVLVAK